MLTLYINCVARKWYLLRRIAQASVRQNTDLPTIKSLKVPFIPNRIQKKICDAIKNSHNMKLNSYLLLNIAKLGVEMAIEEDEVKAEIWIREEVKKIGVKNRR